MLIVEYSSKLAKAVLTVSSTGFGIVFGVITVFPLLLNFLDNREKEENLEHFGYRFVNELVEGDSLPILLISAICLLFSCILALISMRFQSNLLLELALDITLFALLIALVILVLTRRQAMKISEEDIIDIRDHYPDDEEMLDNDNENGDDKD